MKLPQGAPDRRQNASSIVATVRNMHMLMHIGGLDFFIQKLDCFHLEAWLFKLDRILQASERHSACQPMLAA